MIHAPSNRSENHLGPVSVSFQRDAVAEISNSDSFLQFDSEALPGKLMCEESRIFTLYLLPVSRSFQSAVVPASGLSDSLLQFDFEVLPGKHFGKQSRIFTL